MDSSTKVSVVPGDGVWMWDGHCWVLKSRPIEGHPPFDPNQPGPFTIRGTRVGQYFRFPATLTIAPDDSVRVEVEGPDLAGGTRCYCQCQDGRLVSVTTCPNGTHCGCSVFKDCEEGVIVPSVCQPSKTS